MTFFSNDPYFRTTCPKNGEVKIPIDLAWTNICSIKTQFELLRQCPSGGGAGQEYNTVKDLSYERIAVEEYEDMKRRSVLSDDEKTVCAILENK